MSLDSVSGFPSHVHQTPIMSSEKDYVLEISPDGSRNLVTFTVKRKTPFFHKHMRLPLITVLVAFFLPHTIRTLDEYGAVDSMPFLTKFGLHIDFLEEFLENLAEWIALPMFDETRLVRAALLAVFLGAIAALVCLQEPSDSLMVVKDMGVQMSSKTRWRVLNGSNNKEFIPLSDVIDIVVHEGFHGFGQVIFYMCVLTKAKSTSSVEGNGIKVVFPNFLPRKDILLQVWKHSRETLYGETRRHFRRVPGQGLREVRHMH